MGDIWGRFLVYVEQVSGAIDQLFGDAFTQLWGDKKGAINLGKKLVKL